MQGQNRGVPFFPCPKDPLDFGCGRSSAFCEVSCLFAFWRTD